MFKKLLLFAAVALVGFNMDAKTIVDTHVDWTARSWNGYVMGYIPQTNAEEGLIFEWPHFTYEKVSDLGEGKDYEIVSINGEANYVVPTADGGPMESWGIQAHLLPENVATEIGTAYTVTICAKSSKDGATLGLPMSWNWSGGTCNGSIQIGTEWDTYTLEYADEVGGASCWLVGQMYDNEARICVKWVEISHEEVGESKPIEWVEWLVNGDAEGEYGEIPCAYGKEYDDVNKLGTDPHPATIEVVDGSHVFVVHATAVDPNDFPETDDSGNIKYDDDGNMKLSGAHAWQNQFWIESPKSWNKGDLFRVSFDYKASKPANTNTQCHRETPGDYLIWHAIGDVAFTTEWQHFEKEVTVEDDMNEMWSIAFNLNPQVFEAVDFYFDNLKWETMKLDEGYFVAGDFNDENLDEALEFNYDEDNEVYEITIGQDKPASKVKISTRRGNKKAFNASLIKVDETKISAEPDPDEEGWFSYEPTGGKWINLPEAGVWTIKIDEEYEQILFVMIDGAGISSVSVDNAPAVYYNLQGVRVDNPSNGIYIVKTGNKVSKRIIR